MCPLGYNNFDFFLTKWSLPDQKWILNGIRRHIYKIGFSFFFTVSAVFGFNVSNKCKYKQKLRYGNHIDVEFESVEKNAKNSPKRGYSPKSFVYSNEDKFFTENFFSMSFFAMFSTDSKSA